jgi:hypothetical protein
MTVPGIHEELILHIVVKLFHHVLPHCVPIAHVSCGPVVAKKSTSTNDGNDTTKFVPVTCVKLAGTLCNHRARKEV